VSGARANRGAMPLLAAAAAAAGLTGCGGAHPAATGTSGGAVPVAPTPAYRAKIRRLARSSCAGLGAKGLAAQLHVPDTRAAITAAYARTWPPDVRAAARAGCRQGLS
jgi:hypothetical protein